MKLHRDPLPSFQMEVLNLPPVFGGYPMWDLYEVKLSNTFQPKMDGQAEHTIQTLDVRLRKCVIDFKGNWDYHLSFDRFLLQQ